MISVWRFTWLVLLSLALPLQGMAAAGMNLCGTSHERMLQGSVPQVAASGSPLGTLVASHLRTAPPHGHRHMRSHAGEHVHVKGHRPLHVQVQNHVAASAQASMPAEALPSLIIPGPAGPVSGEPAASASSALPLGSADDAPATSTAAAFNCSTCAACCTTSALPADSAAAPLATALGADRLASASAAPTVFLTGGPERPPRAHLA